MRMLNLVRVVPCSAHIYESLTGNALFDDENFELIRLDFTPGEIPGFPEDKLKYDPIEFEIFGSIEDWGSYVFLYIVADHSSRQALKDSKELIKKISTINSQNIVLHDVESSGEFAGLQGKVDSRGWFCLPAMRKNYCNNLILALRGLKYLDTCCEAEVSDLLISLRGGNCEIAVCRGQTGEMAATVERFLAGDPVDKKAFQECYMLLVSRQQASIELYDTLGDIFSGFAGYDMIFRTAFAVDRDYEERFALYFFFLNRG